MRWRAAALCAAGGLLGAAGALVVAVLAAGSNPAAVGLAWAAGLGGLGAAVFLGLPLGFQMGAGMQDGLRRLTAVVRAWAEGRMAERAPVGDGDLGELAGACNDLAAAVSERVRAQRQLADRHAALLAQEGQLAALQERQRLARDLHDAISQRLFAMHLLAAAAARAPQAPAQVWELEALSAEAQREMRALLLQLRPPALRQQPLGGALAELCARAGRAGPPIWRLEIGDVGPLGPGAEDGLFRIAAEAVANVQRHARAQAATLTLLATTDRLILAIDDNGAGFDVRRPSGGLGLAGIAERAADLGGTLRVKSQPGRGTRIEVALPHVRGAGG